MLFMVLVLDKNIFIFIFMNELHCVAYINKIFVCLRRERNKRSKPYKCTFVFFFNIIFLINARFWIQKLLLMILFPLQPTETFLCWLVLCLCNYVIWVDNTKTFANVTTFKVTKKPSMTSSLISLFLCFLFINVKEEDPSNH